MATLPVEIISMSAIELQAAAVHGRTSESIHIPSEFSMPYPILVSLMIEDERILIIAPSSPSSHTLGT